MSFDWDSIKVTNNPDLKEIETSFNPLSELAGTDSDPTIGVGPPSTGDGGEDGGGDGDGPGEGLIDCQPPADYVPCPTQDCFAFEEYQATITDPDNAWTMLTATNALITQQEFPGFSLVDENNVVQPATNNVKLLNAGTPNGPCASVDLYGYKIGVNSGQNSINYLPNGLYSQLGKISNGVSLGGSLTFYMTGLTPEGDIISANSFNKFGIADIGAVQYRDDTVQGTGITVSVKLWNDIGAGTVTISVGDVETVVKTDSADMTGFYTLTWSVSADSSAMPTTVSSASISGNLGGTGFSVSDTKTITATQWENDPPSFLKLSTWDQQGYPVFFKGTPAPANCPKILYIGNVAEIPAEEFQLAVERSRQDYVTPVDCVESWTRPTGCPDCAKPADCFTDCDAASDFVLANPNDVFSFVNLGALPPAPADYPGYSDRFIVTGGNFGNYNTYTIGTQLTNTTGTGTPCSTDLYNSITVGVGNPTGNYRHIPDVVFDKLGEIILPGESITYTNQQYFYLYGKDIDGNAKTIDSWNLLNAIASGSPWTGTLQDNTISFNIVQDTGQTVLAMTYNGYDESLNPTGAVTETLVLPDDITGGFTTKFEQTFALSSAGVVNITNTASVTCAAGTLSTSQTSGSTTVGLDNIISMAMTNGSSKAYTSYFYSSGFTSQTPSVLYTASSADDSFIAEVDKAISRSMLGYVSTETKCTEIPEGCPDVILPAPGGDCPCSCRGTTIDPLGCNPSIITGGLYDSVAVPRTNGVFENYDGSFGRVIEADALGVGVTTSTSINDGMAAVEIGGQLFHALSSRGIDGNWISTDSTYNLEGRPASSGTSALFETSVLLGLANNVGGDTTLVDTWPTFPVTTPFNNTPYFQCHSLNPHLFAADGSSYGAIKNSTAVIARTGPSEFEIYDGSWKGVGVSTSRRVTVPAEVMKPTDNMFWVTVKTQWTFFDVGRAIDFNIPGASAPSQYAWGFTCNNTYYVNGFEIATGQGWTSNSAPPFADGAYYFYEIVPDSSISPQPGLTLKTQTNVAKPTSLTTFADSVIFNEAGAYELFAGFIDIGPGAADIPYTEQGANLKRIDPNNTPYKDCNCP
jgi:hypothetical protein